MIDILIENLFILMALKIVIILLIIGIMGFIFIELK